MKLTAAALSSALAALGVDASKASNQGWATAMCPACGTSDRASLRVNIGTGAYKCYRCNASSAGDDGVPLDKFVASPTSPSVTASTTDLPPLTDELVARYHGMLIASPAVLSDLERRRGWTSDTIDKIGIGWDGSHLWIPVRDENGKLVNARLYDPFKRTTRKSFHYANPEGLKRTTVWIPGGEESLKGHDEVWMFEGEPDAILSAQMGFPTVVITGGAGTWTDEILRVVGSRRVVICYDMDVAGRRGARAVKARLEAHEKTVLHLEFPLAEPTSKDFTDAVIKENRDAKWFRALAREQWEGKKSTDGTAKPPVPVKLGGGVPGEPITVKAHVLGTHTVPVLVPQVIEATCSMNWNEERCPQCPAFRAQGHLRTEVDPESQDLMLLAATPVKSQHLEFKRITGVLNRCTVVRWSIGGMWQVQHLKLIPPMSERGGGDSTMRSAMYVSPADGRPLPVKSNQLYMFNGKVEPDVLSNEWTLLSSDARPAEDDIDSFKLDAELYDALKSTFSPPEWSVDSIDSLLSQEERSIARHVTKVYGRSELLRAVDLVFHSVLQFKFRGRVTTRGWLSLGVFGDTRTGKSETMSTFMNYLGLGKYVMDPANTTYAGLVGGLQQVGSGDKAWTVTWGLIPTNDRGLVVIDEVSSLSVADIGKMSGMRSSGVAEISKIRHASTPARTRLIMAGNPRGAGRMLSSYGTPVEGFMELIGAPEDVARFDMAVAVKQGLDKDKADRELGPQPQPALIDLRRSLVRFAWSRTSDQVEWEDGAEDLCSKLAAQMARDYDHHIPLVEPSEQDLKIARLAVAVAARTFSVSKNDHNCILVRQCHVQFADRVMRTLYDGELGYREYSEYLSRHKLNVEEVTSAIESLGGDVSASCRALLSIRRVNPNSIGMALALDGAESRIFISRMAQNGAAAFDNADGGRNTAMVWTAPFMALLRKLEKRGNSLKERGIFDGDGKHDSSDPF